MRSITTSSSSSSTKCSTNGSSSRSKAKPARRSCFRRLKLTGLLCLLQLLRKPRLMQERQQKRRWKQPLWHGQQPQRGRSSPYRRSPRSLLQPRLLRNLAGASESSRPKWQPASRTSDNIDDSSTLFLLTRGHCWGAPTPLEAGSAHPNSVLSGFGRKLPLPLNADM